jgi:predicted RNA methylase
MLEDERRVHAYREALACSSSGKVVIDVGAGTGLLSIMAALSGAKMVIGIENSNIVKEFRKSVVRNRVEGIVKVMHILAEEAPLDPGLADLIVSEWMGYFLIFERMLPSVLTVRDKCLKPDGFMMPARGKLFLAAFSQSFLTEADRMHAEDQDESGQALIEYVSKQYLISTSAEILDIELKHLPKDFDRFESNFELQEFKDEPCGGLFAWFDVEMLPGIWFSTSP